MPKRKETLTLKTLSIQGIVKLIQNICCNESYRQTEVLQFMLDIVKNIPAQLCDNVFEIVLKKLTVVEKDLVDPTHNSLCINVSDMLCSFVDARITRLDLENISDMIKAKVIDNLHRMPNLRVFYLHDYKGRIMYTELSGISTLVNLTVFRLRYRCNNEILSLVAQNCKNLRVLDVQSSRNVSDEGVRQLDDLKLLRDLNLRYTSVTKSGLALTLKNITGLKKISLDVLYDDVFDKLSEANDMGLEVLHGDSIDVSHMPVLNKLFPLLQDVTFHISYVGFDHESIPLFKQLRIVEINGGHFYQSYINKILAINGKYLTSLALIKVEGLDVNSLFNIAECCPNLTNLKFSLCNRNDRSPLTSNKWNRATFRSLSHLSITFTPIDLDWFLSSHRDITDLRINFLPNVCEDSIRRIIDKDLLKQLESFQYIPRNPVNVAIVYKIIQTLEKLELLRCNAKLTERELCDLRNYVAQNNLKVGIKPDRLPQHASFYMYVPESNVKINVE